MKNFFVAAVCFISLNVYGQLEDGTVAPDFTLSDWYGETHNLYSYLDEGNTVFLEIFAAHCPSCWGYHQTERLKNMYNLYGPEGTGEVMVLALEYDQYNGVNAFTGVGEVWNTAGNWLEGTPYPQFNVEGFDRSVFVDYNVAFYPVVYKICPNRIIERISTSAQEDELYEKVQACEPLSITEEVTKWIAYYDPNSLNILIDHSEEVISCEVFNLQGQKIKSIKSLESAAINVSDLPKGVYLFEFETPSESIIEKIYIY